MGRSLFLMRWAQRASPSFFCLSKRKKAKKKTPDDLPLADARGSLRCSAKTESTIKQFNATKKRLKPENQQNQRKPWKTYFNPAIAPKTSFTTCVT
ncbi:MAG: hypothetical protein KJN79_07075 [Gammaproteobacteria bacterium]|nr:hypothetical protein [Gammaproteobacteria bacterium]